MGFVYGFEFDVECVLWYVRVGVFGWVEEVVLGEVNGDLLGDGVFGYGVELVIFVDK